MQDVLGVLAITTHYNAALTADKQGQEGAGSKDTLFTESPSCKVVLLLIKFLGSLVG